MKYLKYLRYIIIHKWYVMIECFKVGIYWQGITHDLSKFLPSEFFAYANYFYGNKERDRKKGYYKPTDTGEQAFDVAWLLHQKRNKHHWQWWVLPEDQGGLKILEIPDKYVKEMICDGVGAGKAQGFHSPKDDKYKELREYYWRNKDNMQLSELSRRKYEYLVDYVDCFSCNNILEEDPFYGFCRLGMCLTADMQARTCPDYIKRCLIFPGLDD